MQQQQAAEKQPHAVLTHATTHSALVHKPSARVTTRQNLNSVRYGDMHRHCQARMQIDTW